MNRLIPFHRDAPRSAAPRSVGLLRTREPAGLIDPKEATTRLASLLGAEMTAADTSMDRLVIAISSDPLHLLVLAGPLTLTTPDGQVSVCHAPGTDEALDALGGWIGQRVEGIRVLPAGGLTVDCAQGRLFVESGSDYEAWEVRGMDGGLLACLPGGLISLWRPTFVQNAAAL